ncbi:hypothetical protein J1N35_039281 [Gossypium stocksii]|uniref:pyruvate decarboxylase n=1 Tax=Gossypium stocksii TaxID=47602 RepID=A0A9D3ZNL6_9ROSI|nr:hypothetical protein J1N35_039281 [Gossypium stocksii]
MDTKIGSLDNCKPASNDVCSPANGTVSTIQGSVSPTVVSCSEATLGGHLAKRLVQIGVNDVFSVPRDFNLTLLDHLIAEPGLNLIGCCNELNAGYAADGYARSGGVGACVVTFTVGGQELRCFQTVTCYQAVINNLEDAHEMIDTAISTALKESKPVYISIGCNLAAIPHPTSTREPVPFVLSPKIRGGGGGSCRVLEQGRETHFSLWTKATCCQGMRGFCELADAGGYAVAVMPSGKGLVPEHHPHFIGTVLGAVSTAFCAEIVESADAYLFAGPIYNSSVGYSLLIKKEKAIIVRPDRVVNGNGPSFGCVLMKDFLRELAKRLKHKNTAYENYHRICVPEGQPLKAASKETLRVNVLFQQIQKMLSGETAVIAETGDSWFNCQKQKLPAGCGYEFQMQYESIGWSVGATLGYDQAVPEKRVIACIGDGSFQVTAQDVSTMPRCRQKTIIFLINNGGYTIEVEIHDGPYNVIKNWNYTALVDAIHNVEGKCWTTKVFCEEELVEAIETAIGAKKDCLCFIEVIVHKDDTSKELLEWGSRVCAANSGPPTPQ